ncbi:MAG: YpsA SLOG family protein [Solirubrobacterales bacterium]
MRITSGGQTGVDRAALDAAIALGLDYGGWCPAGGWAEDHPDAPGLLAAYPNLRETPLADPAQRTAWNLRDADAALILDRADARSLGTELAATLARASERPWTVVEVGSPDAGARIAELAGSLGPKATLSVGGPRESEAPGIYDQAYELLTAELAVR